MSELDDKIADLNKRLQDSTMTPAQKQTAAKELISIQNRKMLSEA